MRAATTASSSGPRNGMNSGIRSMGDAIQAANAERRPVVCPLATGAMAALKAVTSVAARYLRQQADIGSVAPGRYADFLVVDGDPLRDPRELRKLTTVYRGGVAHDPQAILAQAPQSDLGHRH